MTFTVLRQPSYLLHARAYRETSAIIELLTLEHGRVAGVARGVRGGRRPQPIEAFRLMEIGWRGSGSLVTVTGREVARRWHLAGRALFAGMYVNELLIRSLRPAEAVPNLFWAYQVTLGRLASEADLEPPLRVFEKRLLFELGYGPTFDVESVSGEAVADDRTYIFAEGEGFRVAGTATENAFPGRVLKDIARDRYEATDVRRAAKIILRRALKPHLGPRPLAARELFRGQ